MLKTLSISLVLFPLLAARLAISEDYRLKTVPFNQVEITSEFWKPRLETQRKTLGPFAFEKTQTGVEHLKAARAHWREKKPRITDLIASLIPTSTRSWRVRRTY